MRRPMNPGAAQPEVPNRLPIWKSKSVVFSVAAIFFGLLLWGREPARQQSGTGSPGSLTASVATDGHPHALKPSSPALFRLGAGYLGGFFFGWLLRRSLKMALALATTALVVIALGKHSGLIDLDWAGLQAHVTQSLEWVTGELGALKHFLTGYLPSAVATGIGIFMGARRA